MLNYTRFFLVLSLSFFAQLSIAQTKSSAVSDKDIESMIDKMTIEEKAGQMTQVTIDMILKDDSSTEIDEKKLRFAINEMQV